MQWTGRLTSYVVHSPHRCMSQHRARTARAAIAIRRAEGALITALTVSNRTSNHRWHAHPDDRSVPAKLKWASTSEWRS